MVDFHKAAKIINEDKVTVYAAQASFFIIISVMPFLSLLITIASLFIPADALTILEEYTLSQEIMNVVGTVVSDLQSAPKVSLLSISVLATLWSASKGISAIQMGVETVYGSEPAEGFFSRILKPLISTITFIVLILFSVVLILFGDFVSDLLRLTKITDALFRWGKPIIFAFICITLTILYVSSAKRSSSFTSTILLHLPGAAFASLGWILFSDAFSLYIKYVPRASYIYGGLAAICLILLWLYFCMIILLMGAEINKLILSTRGNCWKGVGGMRRNIKLTSTGHARIREVDPSLVSYNIEMTEITGGTFWKAYTPEQIAGKEVFSEVPDLRDFTALNGLMQYYPPIDLSNIRLRGLAKQLGPAWIRVSGTWATKTYYDFDGSAKGKAPAGYQSVLTGAQWAGVLDFVKAVGGKLLISVSNCAGDHPDGGPLNLTQAKKIFAFSHAHGVDISAIEFMNEPNMMELSGAPAGYTPADYARDQDILYRWIQENYPDCLLVGPCTTGDPDVNADSRSFGAGIASLVKSCTTHALLAGTDTKLDVFSYHCYNGVSERLAGVAPSAHWDGELAHSDEYLAVAPSCAKNHALLRDRYVPGGQMWVTESGDAGGGGDTWASTYLDVFRTLNELGSFSVITDGVIFHNTLASSDYGFLEHGTFAPRPNYFAVLLWNRVMGTAVYDCGNPNMESVHVYCHSRRDGKSGVAYLVINNSLTQAVSVELPKSADQYTLSAAELRSPVMRLNGTNLAVGGENELPDLRPIRQSAGIVELAPATCTFFVL